MGEEPLRKPMNATISRPPCEFCGRPLSMYMRGDAIYCSPSCRRAAWRHEQRRERDFLFRLLDDGEKARRLVLGQ
jgi:hypothetical protein